MFCFERARNEEKVNDKWSASRHAGRGMVNNLCKIEKVLSKLVFTEYHGRTRVVNTKTSNEKKIFTMEILINEVKRESMSSDNLKLIVAKVPARKAMINLR